MALYTVSLSNSYPSQANYGSLNTIYCSTTYKKWYSDSAKTNYIARVTQPTWKNGRKQFAGYYEGTKQIIQSNGAIVQTGYIGSQWITVDSDCTLSERWWTTFPALVINGTTGQYEELVLEDGVWYYDYANKIPLTAQSPMPVPTKENYRFLGIYATNSTSGTKYVNADGTPTQALLSMTISDDMTVYAVFQKVSNTITVNSSYGSYAYKKFYQSTTADANGKYGYYSESDCPESSRIYAIPAPTRELYAWGGLGSKSKTSTSGYYQVSDSSGNFSQAFLDRSSAAMTVYGDFWTQVSYKITVSPQGGSAAVLSYYTHKTNGGVYTDWLCQTAALDSLPIPVRNGYRFLGYYSASSGGTKFVEYTGVVQDALKTQKETDTIYAQWRQATRTVTLNANGGSPNSTVYYDGTDAVFFNASSATVTSVTPPTYTGNTFVGYFDEQSAGTKRINADGTFVSGYAPSSSETLYAQWTIGKSIVDIDPGEGSGGAARIYYDHTDGHFYADSEMTELVTSVTLPTIRLFDTNGLYTESVGGTQVVDASGVISGSFTPTDEFVTVYAQYARRCYETVVNARGGTSAVAAIYHAPGGSTWFSDDSLTTPVANVGVPTRTGYTFGGYDYGSSQVIDANGTILSAAAIDVDYTATADWTANVHTLTFDYNGGTGQTASKIVTFGSPIGPLPTATLTGRKFESWQVNGSDIKPTDVWYVDSDMTAVAKWKDNFGGLTDWFSLDGNLLMLVGSESGEGRRVTNLWNGAVEQGPGLVNPVCTYRIKAAGDVTLILGKAFSSGYFVTGFEYKTGADMEPVLVVSGTANEGADAINLYNVSLHVDPDHVSQDPFGAVSGGGELVELTSAATCDAVVPYENNRPCASDVVHGRKTVSGRTAAYFGENPPTFSGSFIDSGTPKSESDVDFTTYAFAAERAI